MKKTSLKEPLSPDPPPGAENETPWTDAVCHFLKSRKTFEITDFEIWNNHARKMEQSLRFWLAESIWQSEQKQRIHRLLMDADFWLAHLEDFTKGKSGDDITKLRAKIEREMRPF